MAFSVVPECVTASGHTSSQQPTPPASARSRLLCRRESIARLAKSGSFVALRAACAPWLRLLVPRRPPPRPSLRSPSATGRSKPPLCKSSAPRPPAPCGPPCQPPSPAQPRRIVPAAPRRCGCCAPLRLAPSLPPLQVSRSFVAVASAALPSRHPPRKNFGRWSPASQGSQARPNF